MRTLRKCIHPANQHQEFPFFQDLILQFYDQIVKFSFIFVSAMTDNDYLLLIHLSTNRRNLGI